MLPHKAVEIIHAHTVEKLYFAHAAVSLLCISLSNIFYGSNPVYVFTALEMSAGEG
jgi:hypothetical protein